MVELIKNGNSLRVVDGDKFIIASTVYKLSIRKDPHNSKKYRIYDEDHYMYTISVDHTMVDGTLMTEDNADTVLSDFLASTGGSGGGGNSSVIQGDTVNDFPQPGNSNNLYIAKDTGTIYYWNGSAYLALSSSSSGDSFAGYPTFDDFPRPGEENKFYVDLSTNELYIWDGTDYDLVDEDLFNSFLPLAGGNITGTLTVQGNTVATITDLDGYVTLGTTQTIMSSKTFAAATTFQTPVTHSGSGNNVFMMGTNATYYGGNTSSYPRIYYNTDFNIENPNSGMNINADGIIDIMSDSDTSVSAGGELTLYGGSGVELVSATQPITISTGYGIVGDTNPINFIGGGSTGYPTVRYNNSEILTQATGLYYTESTNSNGDTIPVISLRDGTKIAGRPIGGGTSHELLGLNTYSTGLVAFEIGSQAAHFNINTLVDTVGTAGRRPTIDIYNEDGTTNGSQEQMAFLSDLTGITGFLPLTGGTMTGGITFSSGSIMFNSQTSSISFRGGDVALNYSSTYGMQLSSNVTGVGIALNCTAGNANINLVTNTGKAYYNGNEIATLANLEVTRALTINSATPVVTVASNATILTVNYNNTLLFSSQYTYSGTTVTITDTNITTGFDTSDTIEVTYLT